MAGLPRTMEEVVDELLSKAIPNGDCLECHLAPSVDRCGRERQYASVGGRNGKRWGVPRLVLHVKKGPLPDDIWALHTCDNPKCINLDHLFKGTAQDNTDDMITKGRKVDDPEVGLRRRISTANRIRPLYDQGLTNAEISRKLYLSYNTVRAYTIAFSSGHEYPICV